MVSMHSNRRRRRRGRNPPGSGKIPSVSVIVPAYNTAPYIGEALESIFAQTFRDYEVIVINDGSPDTEELERALAPCQDRIVYIKQENRGVGAARNAGIRAARAPLIALLDSDDMWEPDYLAVQVAMLRGDPAIDVMYPDAVYFGNCCEAGRRFMELCPSDGEVTFEALVTQRCNVMNSVTARRDTVVRAGLYDESLQGPEDFDLWLRVLLGGGRIAYHRRVLVRYRRRGGSLMSSEIGNLTQILRMIDKAARYPSLTPREAEVLGRERVRFLALLRFYEGKRSLLRGDIPSGIEAWGEANRFLRSWRLGCMTWLLRFIPGLAVRAYHIRRHVLLGAGREV